MSNTPPSPISPDPPDPVKAAAQRLFTHARKAADTKNYDYAIELYLQGLAQWPAAVEEGLKLLRVTGTARRMTGKKAPGFFETRKYPTNSKEAAKNLLNAYHLFALDPTNSEYLEAILINASKLGLDLVGHWIAPILWETFSRETKLNVARCDAIFKALDQIGDHLTDTGQFKAAAEVYRVAQLFADAWRNAQPNSSDASKAVSSASSKLTIVQGRFGTDEDFRSSLKDGSTQRDLHDSQRGVQEDSRVRELIEKALNDYKANPANISKLTSLADLLTRQESEADETEALKLLTEALQRTGDYVCKFKADDIRMRRARRRVRDIVAKHKAEPNDEKLRHDAETARKQLLEGELAIYEDRIRQYPTDLRLRFEQGIRLFEMGRIDDAIPVLQQAQSEPRQRNRTRLYIGRCFFAKKFYSQAIETFNSTLADHEIAEDEVGKDLQYWLGRTYEATAKNTDAVRVYGQLIQFDYNYRDARQRFEKLAGEASG